MNILKNLDTLEKMEALIEKMEALIEKAERAYLGRSGFGDLSYRLQDLMEGIDDMLKENRVESKRRIRDLEDEVEELEHEADWLEKRVEELELELDELKADVEK